MHEFGHTIDVIALAHDAIFQRALQTAYDAALAKGLWRGTYAATNPREYWAEGVQDWFDANLHDVSDHNEVHTRAQLAAYDGALHDLLGSVFVDDGWRYDCSSLADVGDDAVASAPGPSPATAAPAVVVPPRTNCPKGDGLGAWGHFRDGTRRDRATVLHGRERGDGGRVLRLRAYEGVLPGRHDRERPRDRARGPGPVERGVQRRAERPAEPSHQLRGLEPGERLPALVNRLPAGNAGRTHGGARCQIATGWLTPSVA